MNRTPRASSLSSPTLHRSLNSGRLPYPAALVLIAGAYFGVAKLGLLAAVAHGVVSSAWPPTGLALAVLLLWGVRYWPGIAIGAFLLNASSGVSLAGAAGIGIGNTLEAVVGALWFQRVARPSLDRLRDVLALVLLAAALSTTVSATVGVLSLWLSGAITSTSLGPLWLVWWSGDAMGVLVVAPLLLTWATAPRVRVGRARAVEASVLLLILLGLSHLLFKTPFSYVYAVFPVVAWAALRFGPRGAATATFLVTGLAVGYTLRGLGPFVGFSPTHNLALLQTFIALLAVTALLLAAVITERQQAEAAMRESETRLVRAQETAHLGSWELDLSNLDDVNRNPLWWSDEAFRIFGYVPGEVEVSNELFFRSLPPEDVPRVQQAVQKSLRDGVPYFIEHRVIRPDGSERIVEEQSTLVRDPSGRPVRMVGTVLDVTERKRLEEQLGKAQKMEAVGRLAAGLAHDFNNVLTAILGFADLLLQRLQPGRAEHAEADEIRRAALRAADLTRQLLAFSRQQVLAPQVLSLNDAVASMEKMLRRLIGEDIELRTALARDLSAVRADPGQLEQVIANLAVNARDAMPKGGRLTLETANVDLDEAYAEAHFPAVPGRYVMLAISDTGIGMDAKTRAHIFEPFFTTKDKGKGTGLGLATVYGIVKQSGGYIWAYSEPGHGSSFKIYFPRVDVAVEPAIPRAAPPSSLRGSETVLVVEDEEAVRKIIRRVLENHGYGVLTAADGPDAIRMLSAHDGPIHLLVTDVVMPNMSGRDVAKRVVSTRPETKVLYISGYTDDAIVHHGVLEAGTAFLQKPFTSQVLALKVREVLDGAYA